MKENDRMKENHMRLGLQVDKKKRDYEKPMLRVVDLAAEEVLAVGCKLAEGGLSACQDGTCISSTGS